MVKLPDFAETSDGLARLSVGSGCFGLSGHPERFTEIAARAEAEFGAPLYDIARDYHLHLMLTGTMDRCAPGHRVLHRTTGEEIALLCLGGGHSFTNAFRVSERCSEDLDFGVMLLRDETDASLQMDAKKAVRWIIEDAVRAQMPDPQIRVRKGRVAMTVKAHVVAGAGKFLKADIAIEPRLESMRVDGTLRPLMGRVATAAEIEEFPELGDLRIPLFAIEATVANKFQAQHSRAVNHGPDSVQHRIRDVYDLAAVARSVHADRVREALPWLAGVFLERSWQHRRGGLDGVPRPDGGWADSPVFTPGTEANRAAREAWDHPTFRATIWGWRPSFDEAIELARTLDTVSG